MTRILVFRTAQILIDLLVLSAALWLAFLLRFDWELPTQMLKRAMFLWPYVVGLQYFSLMLMGVPRFAWRYVGLREAIRIFGAVGAVTAFFFMLRLVAGVVQYRWGYAQYALLPLGVIAADSALAFLGVVGVRVVRRVGSEEVQRRKLVRHTDAKPTLLLGAGQEGLLVAKEIANRPELGIRPVGFLDDDAVKHGSVVHGLKVLGAIKDVERFAALSGAVQAIITISNAPGAAVRKISEQCQAAGLPAKIIPGLYQIVGGKLNLTRLRDVAIEDLLRREPVVLDGEAISHDLRGAPVLVTGAGGSIGSELCRQICRFNPGKLFLVERSENALFEIHRELLREYPNLNITPCICDITDRARVEAVFAECQPQVIFHAAAHKHVPMMEWNPGEAIKNNVFGTRLLADVAHQQKVPVFVMVSTDKAVNPTSVMGATKRAAEMYIQALASSSHTRFVTVRFGNVLGSAGSVVPIFREQLSRGGPITVTHPEMRRYFMTIPEACQLILQAQTMGRGGEIFVLDMGEPVKIVDLARDLIRLSGFRADEIEVTFSGVRPGEKLFEELSADEEKADKTRHPKIFVGQTSAPQLPEVVRKLELLSQALQNAEARRLVQVLGELVVEYRPNREDSEPKSLPAPNEGLQLNPETV
ncbi:MAG TPA: nucleoside-diphosphate sugar epimerase/dehydratase [Polyangiaceae bacterium]|nr:nucleoside-diphosphate sugar epimerase/dehydratase [Polyangiaceae bacterium]